VETRIYGAGFFAAAVNSLVSGLGDAVMFVGRFAFVYAILFGLLAVLDRQERTGVR
jgi:uncharacterized membrane protein YfhO